MKNKPYAWVPSLYLGEALPFSAVMLISVIMFQELGLTDAQITYYTGWLGLPWVIKPIWSPIIDNMKTKRWWIVSMQFLMGVALGFQPDSASICAAMRLGVIPSQISPAAWTNSAYSAGTFLDSPLEFSILSDCPPIMAMASGISNRKPTTATATFELIVPPPTGWDWYTSSAGVR